MTFSDFQSRIRWFSQTLKSIPFIHRLPGLSSVMAAMFGEIMAVFGDVMAVLWRCSAMLWRCSAMFGDVMAVFGDVMAGPG